MNSVRLLKFLVWFLITNLLLNNIFPRFLLKLHNWLVYWESLLRFLKICQFCRNVLIPLFLPGLEYCSPVWCSAADSYLRLLNRNLNAVRFHIPGRSVALQHRLSINSLCMLFKICQNPKHPLWYDFYGLFRYTQITWGALTFNNPAFFLLWDLTLLFPPKVKFQLSLDNRMIFLIML